jgi:gentisate 1,2-dioxygenase
LARDSEPEPVNASRTILSERGRYTNVEGERCEAVRGDLIAELRRTRWLMAGAVL